MRSTTFFGIIAVLTASTALTACGSDTTSGTTSGSTGGGGSSSSTGETTATSSSAATSSATSSGTSTSSSSSSTGTGGAGPNLVNGCDLTALVDRTKDATVEITFGDTFKYAPPCIKVKSGTMVTFKGSTLFHPLAGGEVVNGAAMVDKQSPIKVTSNAMPSVTFAISPAGSYPYFCSDHYAGGMQGLIVAE